jgi:hypothetical protein
MQEEDLIPVKAL